ncbi:hypothetical protein G6F50_018684 [Rhizopus delemar]|uniref:Uncharacterized protein n=1 Tax=Rhizopus delemar TaxID=936053 RepID=A0A9P7BYR3_9FUNG|nr:hypothetical protein G6F50_018684 [Rhizopus delemar]
MPLALCPPVARHGRRHAAQSQPRSAQHAGQSHDVRQGDVFVQAQRGEQQPEYRQPVHEQRGAADAQARDAGIPDDVADA